MFYLDSNAHTPLHSLYFSLYSKYKEYLLGHPLSVFLPGRKAQNLIEASREKIAELLGAQNKEQIVFTRGTSQAIEWGVELLYNKILYEENEIAYSNLEHFSVIDVFSKIKNIENQYINQTGYELIFKLQNLNSESFDFHLQHNNLIHIFAHNETGVIYDLNSYSTKNLFSDCAQIIGKTKFKISNYPNLDVAAFSPHKFGGPTGIGILYLKNIESWQEFGAGSRYNFDITGTPDVYSILATAEILEQVIKEQPTKIEKMLAFQKIFENGMREFDCEIIGSHLPRLPNTTFLKLPKKYSSTEEKFNLIQKLEEKEIYPGLGSACGSIHNFENRTMKALGYPESANHYLRFSTFGEYDDLDAKTILNLISDIF